MISLPRFASPGRLLPACLRLLGAAVLALGLLAAPAAAATRVIRVQASSTASSPNGNSWAAAYASLSSALDAAKALNPTAADPVELWIAIGTYKPAQPAADPEHGIFETDPRDGTFAVPSYVSLYGGFAGSETDRGQRAYSDAMTVLSGDIGSIYLAGEAAPTTRTQALAATLRDPENANFADNVTNVLTITNGVGITLDRLLVTAGYAQNLATTPRDYVYEMATPDALNDAGVGSKRAITRAAAGGGLFILSATMPSGTAVTISDCVFTQNYAFGFGGAVSIIRSRVNSRSNYYVANRAADSGGAVFGRAQISSFEGDVMLRNLAQINGGAVNLHTAPVRPANWEVTTARFLFGGDSKFMLDTVGGYIDVAVAFPSVVAPRASLETIEGLSALSFKLGTVVAGSLVSNALGICTGPLKYLTAAIDITDLIVNELRAKGVNGKFIEGWSQQFMPKFKKLFSPMGWYETYKHAFYDDAKFNRDTPEWQVKQAYADFYNPARPTTFSGVRFDHNTAYGDGGALFAAHANYMVERSLFTENTAERSGGGLAARAFNDAQVVNSVFYGNTSAGHSAVCLGFNARLRLLNNTIVNNTSTSANRAVGVEMGSEARVLNCVLWGNTNAALPTGGADLFTARPQDLDADSRKTYDAAPAHRFTFVGQTDIMGSNIQSLADLDNSWGVSDIRYLSGSNLSAGDIQLALALRDMADKTSTTDLFRLTVLTLGGNRHAGRGNISVDPLLHDGWIPGINSPLLNNGRRDPFGLGISPYASETADFLGLARWQDYTTISIGAVQSGTSSTGSSTAEAAGRYFVTTNGAGDKSGRNWANASNDLKTMLAQNNAEVWVAAGTYKPTTGTDRYASFTLGSNTRAYGGFAGTETVLVDRDIGDNLTVLSGDISGGRSYHVIKQVNTTGTILLDGFSIKQGQANGSSENAIGGGAYLFNTTAVLRSVLFDGNTASESGGAVYSAGDAKVSYYDSIFINNTAAVGGAISSINPVLIERCEFDSNTATTKGGAVAVDTNGDSDLRVDFQNSLFSRNTLTATGAGSALYINVMANQIVNCTFVKNSGQVYSDENNPTAGQFGSAVYYDEAGAIIINSIFWKNASTAFLAVPADYRPPLELASFFVSRESSFGLMLSNSNVEGLSKTSPLEGIPRAQGSLSSQYTKVGDIYIRTGSQSNSYLDSATDADPGFVDFANNNFHLTSKSSLADRGKADAAGVGSLDLDSLTRKINTNPDLGAYEFQGTTNSIYSVVTNVRTMTADGPVYALTLHPENPLSGDATFTWMVNKNDGKGFVALPADSRISGQGTLTLTLTQPPSAWNGWTFRVTVGGSNTATAAVALDAKGSDRFFVNAAVAASGDGTTWATAFKTISEATKAALNSYGDYCQIWVAQGTYCPDRYGTETSIFLYEGTVLYGGFKGGETHQNQRNPTLYPTILTGAQPGAVESYDFADSTVVTGPSSQSALPVVIDGVTIRTANRDALYAGGETNVTNCIIENERNRAVGVYNSVSFKNVTFRKAKTRAVYVSSGTVSFENCLFTQNNGPEGASLVVAGGNVTLTASTVADNFSSDRTGGIYVSGGNLTIDRSILWNNRDNRTELGGSIEASQLSFNSKAGGSLTVKNSLIESLASASFTTGANTGNAALHPLFNDAVNGNYTLDPKSPAIPKSAGAFPYVGTPGTVLNFTSVPASTEERVSLFSKVYTITWATGTSHTLTWQIDLGNGWVSPTSTALSSNVTSNSTSSTLTLSSGNILPSLKVRAVNAANLALPPITLKVIPPLVRYVNAAATGTADGLSWNTAWRTLKDAYYYGNIPGPNVEFWVAKGTYVIDAGNIRAQPGIALYGGFAGTEASISQRNLALTANTTTLKGTFAIQEGSFSYGAGLPVIARAVGRQVVLDGFTLVRDGSGGAAMLQASAGAGIIRNCIFTGNYGHVSLSNVSTVFEKCTFTGSTESAIRISNANPTFRECTFTGNYAPGSGGGAIKSTYGDILIDRSTFTNNSTRDGDGGAIHATGGSLKIANTLFTGNTTNEKGGAIYAQNALIVNCTFSGNRATKEGGGFFAADGAGIVSNSIFWGNTTGPNLYGDALYTQKSQLVPVTGSIAVNNSIIEGLISNLGANNLPYNPLFASSTSTPYALSTRSPALGRALASDLEAISPIGGYVGRLQGAGLDLGYLESAENDSLAPVQLSSSPISASVFSGASVSFTVTGANTGSNVIWQRLVNGVWVDVVNGFTVSTTGTTSSTLTVTNASAETDGQTGEYRYRILPPSNATAANNYTYVSASFTLNVAKRTIVYVDANAADGGNGKSWGTAFKYIAAAVGTPGDALEIRLAAGTYGSPGIALRPGLYFRGGYPATGTAAERLVSNPAANPTIITGGSVSFAEATNMVFNTSTGFEGITFRTPTGAQQYQRGVIVFFRNCRFEDNPGGSGGFSAAVMFDYSSIGLFEDCTFANNRGVAVAMRYGSTVRIVRGTFTNNRFTVVGVAREGTLAIEDSVFSGNDSTEGNYTIHTDLDTFGNYGKQHTILRTRFTNNTGAGTLIGSFGSPLLITDSLFDNNGSTLAYIGTNTTLRHVTVVDNVIAQRINGPYVSSRFVISHGGGALDVANSIFWNNRSIGASDSREVQQIKRTGGGSFAFNSNIMQGLDTFAGNGTGNSALNPLFTDASTRDYTLSAYSPAIGTGLTTATTATDFRSLARTNGSGTDIGAYDFGVGASYAALSLTDTPVTINTYLRNTGSITVTAPVAFSPGIVWQRWNGTTFTDIDPLNPGDARLKIVSTGSVSTLSLSNVSLTDTIGYAFKIGGYRSAVIYIKPIERPRMYVDASNTLANGDGSTWAKAVRNMEWAYQYAAPSSEIWVKQGSYSAGGTIRADIEVYGGFATNTNDVNDRQTTGEGTVLNGQFVGRSDTTNAVFDGVTFICSVPAVSLYGGANPTFRHCVFRDSYSSAVSVSGNAAPRFEDCSFRNNRLGGIALSNASDSAGNVVVLRSSFTGGGRALDVGNGQVLVSESSFTGNRGVSRYISIGGGRLTLDRCRVQDNIGESIISPNGGTLTLRNSLVSGNTSSYLGVIDLGYRNAVLEVIQSTIANNESLNGPGGISLGADNSMMVENSVFWGNRGRFSARNLSIEEQQLTKPWNNASYLSVNHSLIEGYNALGGTGNVADAPLFVDANTGNFRLSNISPAINAGNASLDQSGYPLDLTGATRVAGSAPDLGAYEFQGTPGTPLRIVRSPSSLDVELNGTAAFIAQSAEAGTFTWQVETAPDVWTTIATGGSYVITTNGTTSTLTINGATLALNGARYRYLFGSVASAPFGLTVVNKRIIYVDATATGTATGTTWATAFRTMQDAFTNWTTGAEIWVASKTTLKITQPLVLEEGMRIYGGFAGNESTLTQRTASAQTSLQDPSNVGIGYLIDQSATSVTRATVFDGFKLYSNHSSFAMWLNNSSPTFRNCAFDSFRNYVVHAIGSAPLFENCTFANNYNRVINNSGSSVEIVGCTFTNTRNNTNSPENVILIQGNLAGQPVKIRDTVFRSNSVSGPYVGSGSSATFDRVTWIDNSSTYTAVLNVAAGGSAAVTNSLIANNRGAFLHDNNLSALIVNSGTLAFTHVTVAGNTVASSGGGGSGLREGSMIYNLGPLTVRNSIFAENTVTGNVSNLTVEQRQIKRGNSQVPVISSSLIAGLAAYAGNNNVGFDPIFDPAFPGEYRLSIYSPAVNAGDNTAASLPATDLTGANRLVGTAVDLGARELTETVGVAAMKIALDANSANIVPVWSTADGKLSINGDVAITSRIYWQVQVNGAWVGIAADPSLSSFFSGSVATLTIAAPATDDIEDRLVRFGLDGTSYISAQYLVTTKRNNVRFVSPYAAAGGDGLTWNTAYNNLAEAIANSPSHTELWLGYGTFTDTATIDLPRGFRFYGGFLGSRETSLSERRPANNKTRIRNSFTISNLGGTDTPIFDGVILETGGVALHHRSAIFRNVRFEGGAALTASSYAPSLLLEDCAFVDKNVALSGFIDNVTIRRTTFTGNEQAIAANGLVWLIEDSTFSNSVNRTNSFAPHFISSVVPSLTVRRTTFTGANSRNPAVTLGEPNGATVVASFTDCSFTNNKSTNGSAGILEATGLTLTLDRCVFTGNAAQGSIGTTSGVMRAAGGADLTIRNSYFANNSTVGTTAPFAGAESWAMFYLNNSTTRLTGVTMVNNSAPGMKTAGIFVSGGSLAITNSILYGNTAANTDSIEQRQLNFGNSAVVTATYTLIEGLNTYAGTGNIGHNPRFIGVSGRLVPGPDSPARNAGDNTQLVTGETDLFGNARTYENAVDLGAVEPTTVAVTAIYDIALSRRIPGAFLEYTFNNTSNYTGLVWQMNTGSGWVNVPLDATTTSGTLRTLRLPWDVADNLQLRLVGPTYTSPAFAVTRGATPPVFGNVTATTPASGSTATSTRPNITFSYDQATADAALTPTSFVVHSSMHGRLHNSTRWGSVTSDLVSPVLTPGITFSAGETIDVSSTREIFSKLGGAFNAYVSRFSIPWTSRYGRFRQSAALTTTGNVTGAAAGDINGDGKGDVMFTGDDGAWIYLGDGEGGFTRFRYGAAGSWNAFALADFNGDGQVDFVGSRGRTSLSVESLDVAGVTTTNLLTAPVNYAGSRLLPGDFNGDGRQDVLVLGPTATDGEVLLLNNGDGTFLPASTQRFAASDNATREAAVADLNHDGALDFVQVRATSGDIIVWLNNGAGVFTSNDSVRIANTQTIALTDLDRDGWTDLVVASDSTADSIFIFRNDQTGRFVQQRAFAAGKVKQLAAADFDGDNDIDLLAITGSAADTLWTNNGGVFTATALGWTSYNASAAAQIAVADLNADGAADVAIPQTARITFWTPGNYLAPFTLTLAEATPLTLDAAAFSAALTPNVNPSAGVNAVDGYILQTLPTNGTLKLNGTALTVGQVIVFGSGKAYTYTPTGHYFGTDSFRVAPRDGSRSSPGARVTLNITRVVDAPVTTDQSVRAFLNTPRVLTLLATHPENEAMTFAITTAAEHGIVSVSGDEATYIPATDYTGPDSFGYTVSDSFGNHVTGTITIDVSTDTEMVTNANPSGPGSLAAAITTLLTQGAGRIAFDASLNGATLTLGTATDTVHGPTAALVTGYFEIDGSDAPGLTIKRASGTAELRFFRVTSTGTLILKAVTLEDGVITSETAGTPARGAAIYNEGTLRIDNTAFANNYAHGTADAGAEGGAIYSASGSLTIANAFFVGNHAEDDSAAGIGGALFLRNTPATFKSVNFAANVAPTSGATVHLLAADAEVATDWTNTAVEEISAARTGSGTIAFRDRNAFGSAVPTFAPSVTRPTWPSQIYGVQDLPVTTTSATTELSVTLGSYRLYDGTNLASVSALPATSTSRVIRFRPPQSEEGHSYGGYVTLYVTATEDGIAYTNESEVLFLSDYYGAPTANDQEVYVIDDAHTEFTLDVSHQTQAVTLELLTAPEHGTLSPAFDPAIKTYTYIPAPGYRGDDYLIYRANTVQDIPTSARVTFRNIGTTRLVTTAEPTGPGSLSDVLAHTPSILYSGTTWSIRFAPELAGQTITLATTPLDTPAGPSAFVVNGNVDLDGTDAPGLKIVRADTAPAMRLFYVGPFGFLTLTNITLGNGLALGEPGQPGRGGAIYFDRDDYFEVSGDADLLNVTFENNVAAGGTGANGEGGAIYGIGSQVYAYQNTFSGNTALGGAGGTGLGGAVYMRSGGITFGGSGYETGSTLTDNDADLGADVAIIADGNLLDAPMEVRFFGTDTDGLYTSLINGGALTVDSMRSAVSGPDTLSLAPRLLNGSLEADLPLTLGGGPAESFELTLPPELSSGQVTLAGTLAAPVLHFTTAGFDMPAYLSVTAVRGNERFIHEYFVPGTLYYPPYVEGVYGAHFDVTMNQPLEVVLFKDVHPLYRPDTRQITNVQLVPEDGQPTPATLGTFTEPAEIEGTFTQWIATTYTPPHNFVGTVTFDWITTDSRGGSSTQSFTLVYASGWPQANLVTGEAQGNGPGQTTATSLRADGTHETGDAITYAVVNQPLHGTVTNVGGTNEFLYTPNAGYLSEDHVGDEPYGDMFTYKVIDSLGRESAPGEFYVWVLDLAAFQRPVVTGVPPAPGVILAAFSNSDANLIFSGITITDPDSTELIVTLIDRPNAYYDLNVDWQAGGGGYYTTGTPEQVTERLRAAVYYSAASGPKGTLIENEPALVIVSDTRNFVEVNVPVRGLVEYSYPTATPRSLNIGTTPNTPVTFTRAPVQAEGRAFQLGKPTFVRLAYPGPVGSEVTYDEITGTLSDGATVLGTLTGGPAFGPGVDFIDVVPGSVYTYTFTPAPDFNDVILVDWRLPLKSDPEAFVVGIAARIAINSPPVAANDTFTRGYNSLTMFPSPLRANDTDPDLAKGDTITVTSADATSANGIPLEFIFSSGAGGRVIYPASSSVEDDSFQYTITDSYGLTSTATVFVKFTNTVPVPQNDTVERTYGQPLTITGGRLLANDTDPENDGLSLAAVSASSAQGGTVSLADGVVTYTPPTGTTLGDSFTYTIVDSRGGVSTVSATVTITISNRPPLAGDLTLTRYNDQPAVTAANDLIALSNDPDGDTMQVSNVDEVSVLGADVALNTGTITYQTSSARLVRDEDFYSYTLKDSHGATATGYVTVQLINRAPVAIGETLHRYNDDATTNTTLAALLVNDSDPDGDDLVVDGVDGISAQGGTITVIDGVVTYTPPAVPFGATDSFGYTIKDEQGATAAATVTIVVDNRAPTAVADEVNRFNTEPATVTTATLLANDTDPDGDTLTFVSADATSAQGATITVEDGTVTYTAASPTAITGDDTFSYKVKDAANVEATGTVTVHLVNRAPTPQSNVIDRYNDQPGTITVAELLANDTDPDGDELTFVSVSGTSTQGATVSVSGGTVTYTAASPTAITGDDTFTYTVKDTSDETAIATVTVKLLNRAPTAVADTVSRTAGQPATVTTATLLANDTDPDGDTLTFVSADTTSAQGVPITVSGGTITYTPAAYITGDDTFTYTIEDASHATSTATVTVTTLTPSTAAVLTVTARSGGGVNLALTGVAFTRYALEVSTDLVTWTPLTTVTTNTTGTATAEDATAPAEGAARFYRATAN